MFREVIRRLEGTVAVIGLVALLAACGGGDDIGSQSLALPDSSSDSSVTSANPVTSVTPVSVGNATVNWSAPSSRADGQPLSPGEIQGYRIYYGTASGQYVYSINIDDGSASSYTVQDLPVGTYYFVLTTVDSNGRESGYSTEAVRTVTT